MTLRYRFPVAAVCAFACCLLAAPLDVLAQGKGQGAGQGRPKAPKEPKNPTTSSPSSSGSSGSSNSSSSSSGSGSSSSPSSPPASQPTPAPSSPTPVNAVIETTPSPNAVETVLPTTTFRQFGAWLDDASVAGRGDGYVSISAGHWRLADATQTNVPMVGFGAGVTDRVQLGISVPFYRVNYQGTTSSGLDDVYVNGKISLLDPTLTLSEIGLAVSPVLEILNGGTQRLHFAVPVSFEVRRAPFRTFVSGGYFSRGSLFSGAALEWTSASGTTFSGSLTQSYSLNEDLELDASGISRQRVDVTGSVSRAVGRSAIAFGSVGRSLSSIAEGGTRLAVSGGVTFRFSGLRAP